MKKIFLMILAAGLFTFTACGGGAETDATEETEDTVSMEEIEEEIEEEVEEVAEDVDSMAEEVEEEIEEIVEDVDSTMAEEE